MQEYNNRYKANLEWMDEVFKNSKNSKAMVLFIHANPLFEAEDNHFKNVKSCISNQISSCVQSCKKINETDIHNKCLESCNSESSADSFTKACYSPFPENGFNSFLKKLTSLVSKYKKPVLMVQGDHHKLLFDRPLKVETQFPGIKKSLPNFYRLQVYGAPEVGAVKVNINTTMEQPFSINPFTTIPWEY